MINWLMMLHGMCFCFTIDLFNQVYMLCLCLLILTMFDNELQRLVPLG